MSYNLDQDSRQRAITNFLPSKKSRLRFAASMKDYTFTVLKEDLILVDDNLKPQQIIQMSLDRNIKHIIQNSKLPLAEKFLIIDAALKDPINFLTFYTKIFTKDTIDLKFSFHSKENRTELVNKIMLHLGLEQKNHNTEHILKISEELIMNAQMHAPKIGDFKSPHNMGFLVEKKNDYVALSVFDDYGSLNLNKFFNKILNTFSMGHASSINYGLGGAGLGSSIIFDSAEVFYIGLLPKKITRVTVLCPIKVRAKDREVEQKSIHIIDSL